MICCLSLLKAQDAEPFVMRTLFATKGELSLRDVDADEVRINGKVRHAVSGRVHSVILRNFKEEV